MCFSGKFYQKSPFTFRGKRMATSHGSRLDVPRKIIPMNQSCAEICGSSKLMVFHHFVFFSMATSAFDSASRGCACRHVAAVVAEHRVVWHTFGAGVDGTVWASGLLCRPGVLRASQGRFLPWFPPLVASILPLWGVLG